MESALKQRVLRRQRDEITESEIYQRLARREKEPENRAIFLRIAADEARHATIMSRITGEKVAPDRIKVALYLLTASILGVTFAIKLMERGEGDAEKAYSHFVEIPEIYEMAAEEEEHEQQLIEMINEERLNYMGSIVLGLNDALVEFTGALAGFTLALQNSPLIALTGSITGIAAALSMASSEYLSTRMGDSKDKHAIKASIYTGIAYLITVFLLVLPFILFTNVFVALAVTILFAVIVIALFNYYYSVVKGESFRKRFVEMTLLSFGVASVSFGIGYLLKLFTGIDI